MPIVQRSVLGAMALAGAVLACASPAAAPTFTILITAKQNSFQSGSELKVNVLLTNISDHPIELLVDKRGAAELEGYTIEVRDMAGHLQRTSRYYWSFWRMGGSKLRAPKGTEGDYSDNRHDGLVPGSLGYVNPQPGKTNEAWFDVNKLYAPLPPGRYTIQVQKVDEESKTTVVSNTITVSITK